MTLALALSLALSVPTAAPVDAVRMEQLLAGIRCALIRAAAVGVVG